MKSATFEEVVSDQTSKYTKIPKEEYLPAGKYKIIDQGQQFIGGYTNRKDLINASNLPVIVFGDHTKIFKFIDFPFTIGADGTKVLSVKRELADTKYVYYFLKSLKLPVAGYSRHFKFLKGKRIPLPQINDQIHIANVLSRCEELMCKRKESLRLLDEFLKSTFLEMFGDPFHNPKHFGKDLLQNYFTVQPQNGLYKPSSDYGSGTRIVRIDSFYNGKIEDINTLKRVRISDSEIDKYKLVPGQIVINRVNSREYLGKVGLVPEVSEPTVFESNMMRFAVDTTVLNPVFLVTLLSSRFIRSQILRYAKDAVNQSSINQQDVRNLEILVPPIDLQTQFAQIVGRTEALKAHYKSSLKALKGVCESLSKKAYEGKLLLKEERLTMAAESEGKYKMAKQ